MTESHSKAFFGWLLIVLPCTLLLGGCGTQLSKVVRVDRSAPAGYVEVNDRNAGIVRVIRSGRRLDPRTPMALQPGDEIGTGPDAGAVIRLENGVAVLAPNTHVRLGSLEVLFGKVLADIRGLFEIENDTVVAAVEGTRFMFEAEPKRRVRVAVLEGRVRCISKRGAWSPVRVNAGEAMHLRYRGDRSQPRVDRLSREEIARIEDWSGGIRGAAREGFCCSRGRVTQTLSNQCPGRFEESERQARYHCQSGWCCSGGQVRQTTRSECRGQFSTSQVEARRACESKPPPETGWCCIRGAVKQADQRSCIASRGQFYTDAASAKRSCRPVIQLQDRPAGTTEPQVLPQLLERLRGPHTPPQEQDTEREGTKLY